MSKHILITGANKGIGFQIASELGKAGHKIFLCARNKERGQQATNSLVQLGLDCTFVQMDVGKPEEIQKAFQAVNNEVDRLDVLINNAGILFDEATDLLQVNSQDALDTFSINTLGPLWVTQAFLPLLKRDSRIIMLSSGAGAFCEDFGSWAPVYSSSKTALNALTRHLHRSLSPKGILINAMCPGWVRTDMGGSGASRSLEKGAETAVWLATEAPESVNGQFLRDKKPISW